jgi:hypothetical protein
VAERGDFQKTVVAALNQLGEARKPNGDEVLLLGQSADGSLWSRRIGRRYWLLENLFVSGIVRTKMLDRIAIVGANRIVLIDRTDPIDAGAGQDKRLARLSSAARRVWVKAANSR